MPQRFSNSLFSQAALVQAEELIPRQQRANMRFKRSCDFYEYYTLKHPFLSEFHSKAEYYNSGLLEGNSAVSYFVPQPFQMKIRGKWYQPDCYFLAAGRHIVQELKPKGEFPDDKRIPLEQFFALHNMEFQVVNNDDILARAMEAENWIEIVHTLYASRSFDTQHIEPKVAAMVAESGKEGCILAEIVDPGDRERTFYHELALFRLLHRGLLKADLTSAPLDYNTEFIKCT